MKKIIFTLIITLNFLVPSILKAETAFDQEFKANKTYHDVVIKEILSVNKFRLESGEIIELIGLKGPEVRRKREPINRDENGFVIKDPVSPLIDADEQSFLNVEEMLLDNHVRLEFDVQSKSDEQINLAYAFTIDNNTFLNAEILRKGCASLSIQPPNTKYADALREAYKEARQEQRGLHNK